MNTIRLVSEPDARQEDLNAIENSINEFNMTVTGDRNYKPVRIFVRELDGRLRGGITADLWGGWMHIIYLWVDPDLRDQDLGSQLVQAAENEARSNGCLGAWLETFSFQARPFYEKLGYEVIADMQDYPPGHHHYILQKRLDEN